MLLSVSLIQKVSPFQNPSWEAEAVTPPGTANAVLAWSYDGRAWEYILPNESFLPRGAAGSWDACSVFGAKQAPTILPDPPSMPPGIDVDELPLWYAGCNGAWEGPRACGLGLASVGRHAFAGYRGGVGGGTVQTAPISIRTGDLRVTASGGVTVAVPGVPSLSHEACKPVSGTSVGVEWAGVEGGLGNFSGGALALEFFLPPRAIVFAMEA